jgi:hypothetical protein
MAEELDLISIPDARRLLTLWAEEYQMPQLAELASRMYRRSAVRRAPRTSPHVTREMAEEMREYADNHPNDSEQDIAEFFGVNPGRVSEALHHLR